MSENRSISKSFVKVNISNEKDTQRTWKLSEISQSYKIY